MRPCDSVFYINVICELDVLLLLCLQPTWPRNQELNKRSSLIRQLCRSAYMWEDEGEEKTGGEGTGESSRRAEKRKSSISEVDVTFSRTLEWSSCICSFRNRRNFQRSTTVAILRIEFGLTPTESKSFITISRLSFLVQFHGRMWSPLWHACV